VPNPAGLPRPQGKLNSQRNNLHHGILARTVVLPTESLDRFHELLNTLHADYQPQTPTEAILVDKMVVAHWRLMRLWSHQKAAFALELREQSPAQAAEDTPTRDSLAFGSLGRSNSRSPSHGMIDRYELTYDRQFARALRLLREEQNLRVRTNQVIENNEAPLESEPEESEKTATITDFSPTKQENSDTEPSPTDDSHKHNL
jgi:hypothetical protein